MGGKIYVVVPVFNRWTLTERFLCCLREQSFRDFETIVVDDGSSDGTSEAVRTKFSEVHLLRGDGNLWWTGAINLGIRQALVRADARDAIVVINNDLEVEPDYLQSLAESWKSTPRTLIGSVAVDIDKPDLIVDGGTRMNRWTAKTTRLAHGERLSSFSRDYFVDVSALSGRGTLIPIEVLRKTGLYNGRHYQQCGDYELPIRASNAGFRLIVNYSSVVKIHTDASHTANVSAFYTLKDVGKYFFDKRSNTRLKLRLVYAYDTAANPLSFMSYVLFDLIRITGHFLRRLRFRIDRPGML